MGKMVGAGAEIFDMLEQESESKFLTSWSRSRTKMDRLRSTDINILYLSLLVSALSKNNTGIYFQPLIERYIK
jgi:hypothetical protein